jgi:hypothetical protein
MRSTHVTLKDVKSLLTGCGIGKRPPGQESQPTYRSPSAGPAARSLYAKSAVGRRHCRDVHWPKRAKLYVQAILARYLRFPVAWVVSAVKDRHLGSKALAPPSWSHSWAGAQRTGEVEAGNGDGLCHAGAAGRSGLHSLRPSQRPRSSLFISRAVRKLRGPGPRPWDGSRPPWSGSTCAGRSAG